MTMSVDHAFSANGKLPPGMRGVRLLVLCAMLLSGCGALERNKNHAAIHQVATSGKPAAANLIWSRTELNKMLISASDVGNGLMLGKAEVYVLDVATGARQLVARTDAGALTADTWSPDDKRIVLEISANTRGYERYTGLWIWEVGTDSFQFLRDRGRAIWSPDGKTIAILENSGPGGLASIVLVDLATGNEASIAIGDVGTIGYIGGGDWSADSRGLVISIGDPPSILDSLYVYDLSTRGLSRITQGGNDSYAVWSPRADRIAYVRHVPSTSQDSVHLIKADGTCDVSVADFDAASSLSWSPDGAAVAFIGLDGIYTLDLSRALAGVAASSQCQ